MSCVPNHVSLTVYLLIHQVLPIMKVNRIEPTDEPLNLTFIFHLVSLPTTTSKDVSKPRVYSNANLSELIKIKTEQKPHALNSSNFQTTDDWAFNFAPRLQTTARISEGAFFPAFTSATPSSIYPFTNRLRKLWVTTSEKSWPHNGCGSCVQSWKVGRRLQLKLV